MENNDYEFTKHSNPKMHSNSLVIENNFHTALIDELDAINKNLVKLTEALNNLKEQ